MEKWRVRVRVCACACSRLAGTWDSDWPAGVDLAMCLRFPRRVSGPGAHCLSVCLSGVIPKAKEDGVPGRVLVSRSLGLPGWGLWGTPCVQAPGRWGARSPQACDSGGHAAALGNGRGRPRGDLSMAGLWGMAPRPTSPTPPHPVVATTWDMLGGAGGRLGPAGGGQKPDVSEGS